MADQEDRISDDAGLSPWQLINNLGDSMAVMDLNYRLVWLREPLMDKGHPKRDCIGLPCYALFGDGKGPCRHSCPVAPVIAHRKPRVVERHFIDPEGVERWREARAFPIVDSKGKLVYVARISFDITQRKQTEAKQQRKQDELERTLADLNRVQLSQLPFQPSRESALTSRELEVLRLLAQGHHNPELASLLGISVNTVKRHIGNIFNKLDVNDRIRAAVWAARNGLV